MKRIASIAAIVSLAGCAQVPSVMPLASSEPPQTLLAKFASYGTQGVSGAGFTTFDAVLGGSLDSPNGINANNYVAKDRVYMSGGPVAAGLEDGTYYFAVLNPGAENGGFIDGAAGNLSDTQAGGTAGDNGSGDDISNRTFTVVNHQITEYAGTHARGTSPNGQPIIGLAPFDDTKNAGGVYILAICNVGATSPMASKYDAFRIQPGFQPDEASASPIIRFGQVAGNVYYDTNTNGQRDPGEPGLQNWPVDYQDGATGTVASGADGSFSLSMVSNSYRFAQRGVAQPWIQTGNLANQTSVQGMAEAILNADKSYAIKLVDDSSINELNFGNVCLGAGGGHTRGFWSNKNGQSLIIKSGEADLQMLKSLNLKNADGSDFDPANAASFRDWIVTGTAENMANMLSVQLAAMALNVQHGFVNGEGFIFAPGTSGANANGFSSVNAVMAEATAALAADGQTPSLDPNRSYQEALKNALDNANNNVNFVLQPSQVPTPQFP